MTAPIERETPVLYLDVDDTLLSMHTTYYPRFEQLPEGVFRSYGYAPPGGRKFLLWALEHFEVRWLTWWCSSHEMEPLQLARLEEEFGLDAGSLAHIRSARFNHGDAGRCLKTSGIQWDEHDAGRGWWWLEDGISEDEKQVLRGRHAFHRWIPCNVSEDPHALENAHGTLRAEVGKLQPCGHPTSEVVSEDEGTAFCGACERGVRA